MRVRIFFLLSSIIFASFIASAQTSIDTSFTVDVGNIKQYISIKSADRSKPVLLFLHGGPGGSVMSYAQKFTKKLQQHFVVVQWDQRETGKTLEINSSPVPLSAKLFVDDTDELITFLLRQFHRDRLFLVGHSWGTYLGFEIARQHPEKVSAFIGIGPMVDQLQSERLSLEILKQKATRENNNQAASELNQVEIPFKTGEQLYFHRKWLLQYQGSKTKLSKSYVEEWAARWLLVFNEASHINYAEEVDNFNCPLYFFLGRNDIQTNSSLASAFLSKANAPKKGVFWFEKSAHGIPSSEPELLQSIIIEKILPTLDHK